MGLKLSTHAYRQLHSHLLFAGMMVNRQHPEVLRPAGHLGTALLVILLQAYVETVPNFEVA